MARKIFAPILATLMVAGLSTGLASPAKADNVSNTITIHYQDPDATGFDSYKDWNLWLWANGPTTSTVSAPGYWNGSDSYGKSHTFTIADSAGVTSIGVIVRTDSWDKVNCGNCTDGGNRTIALDPSGTTEVWILKGAADQYTTSAPAGAATSPWASGAVDPNFDCDSNNVCIAHVVMPANQHVVIHYQDPTATGFKSYLNWDTYMWNTGTFGDHAWFNGSDSFGKVLTMDWTGMDKTKSFGLIIRKLATEV
jgi:pullulanase